METLEREGFTVYAGVAAIPIAFAAGYGTGDPVIGIIAEYDALPGLTQSAIPPAARTHSRRTWACVWSPSVRYSFSSRSHCR